MARSVSDPLRLVLPGHEEACVSYRFNPPPGWDVPPGFTPAEGWKPDPAWPAAPTGWEFWLPDTVPGPPPQSGVGNASASATAAAAHASEKLGGMFKSLKTKAHEEDWAGKAKAAATQAQASAQHAAQQASAKAKERDQSTLDAAGEMPEGALWRGVSHETGRNSIVTLYPDRIERTKPTGKMSVTGMLTGGPEDVEVIPLKAVSSVQVKRGAWYHDVTIYTTGNTIVLSVDAGEAEKVRGLVMEQILGGSQGAAPTAAPAAPPAPALSGPAAPSGDDIIGQIRKLGELRDAGLLTDAEFDAKKAELLGRI